MNSILIVEDEILIVERLKADLKKHGYDIVGSCDTVEQAIFMAGETFPDLVLMDIRLKSDMSGIEGAEFLSQRYSIPIIFLTDVADEHLLEKALDTLPSNYIAKPYQLKQLLISIKQALHTIKTRPIHEFNKSYVLFPEKSGIIKISYQDICYIEAGGSYTDIYLKSQTAPKSLSYTLGKTLKVVQSPDILRVHRSYAVNVHAIDLIRGNQIVIGEKIIPVSEKYRKEVKFLLNRF